MIPHDRLVIRPANLQDLGALHELWTMPGVMWGTTQIPSLTLEMARQRAERSLVDPDMHWMVAELDGLVVGSANLHVGVRKRRYTGDVGIAVHDAHVNKGIGRALMEALLDIADNHLGLKRVELEVVADNAAAVSLYESLGFEREGVKHAALFRAGGFVDTVVMARVR